MSLLWYVASSNDQNYSTFDPQTGSVYGYHASQAKTFWLTPHSHPQNVSPVYKDSSGNSYKYDSTYYSALNIDESDQYQADKYFYNELKDAVRTTPPHLADAASLYREENTFSGNLVTVQQFFELPFTVDLQFGYRQSAWSYSDPSTTTSALSLAKNQFETRFNDTFVNENSVT